MKTEKVDLKGYRQLLTELSKMDSYSQLFTKANKLIAIKVKLGDPYVGGMIDELADKYSKAYTCTCKKLYLNAKQYYDSSVEIHDKLLKYCESVLQDDVPAWMIIARANGWRPY